MNEINVAAPFEGFFTPDQHPDQPTAGLVQFKLGTDGDCAETVGEWEFVLSPLWHKAFELYRRVRS